MSGFISGPQKARGAGLANLCISMNIRAVLIPAGRAATILWASVVSFTLATGATTGDAPGNPFGAKLAASASIPAANVEGTPANPFGPKPEPNAAGSATTTPGQAGAPATDDGIAKLRAMLLQRFDKNGDGKLDAAELTEARKVLSGRTNVRPLTPAQAAQAAKGPLFGLRPLLNRFDANGDGVFDDAALAKIHQFLFANATTTPNSANDLDALRRDIVSHFDKSGDGKLDDAERAAATVFLQQMIADLDQAGRPTGGKSSVTPPSPSIPPSKAVPAGTSGTGAASGPTPAGSGEPVMQ